MRKRFLFLGAAHHTVIQSVARNLSFCVRRALFMEGRCYRLGPAGEMIERFCVRGGGGQRGDGGGAAKKRRVIRGGLNVFIDSLLAHAELTAPPRVFSCPD